MSIRRKLTIMFLAIALLPLLFVSDLTYTNYKKSLEANHLAQMQDLTVFRADRIESYFSGIKSHIEIAQGFYNVKTNLPVLIRLASDQNNSEFVAAKKMLDAQLQQMQSVSDLSDIMLINPQGRVIYTSNNPRHYSKDMSNGNDAEQKAFSQGKNSIYFSDVYFDKTEDNRFEILLTAPASDFNGAFIGVIAFEVDMTPLYKLIQDRTGLGETGEVLVARRIGNQVEYLNPLRHEPNSIMKRINIGDKFGGPIQEAVQGKTGVGRLIDYRGKSVIAAWRYIPSLDWGLVAKIDTAEAFADVTNLRNLSIIIMVIIFVLAGIVALSIARSISEPITRLSQGAAIVGSGNLDYQIGTNLNDEIGQLSRSFDKMTQDLKTTTASRDELNIEIEERKQAEEELRQSEIKYRTVADNTYDWEFWLDPQGQFIYCSPSCERITGHKAEEFFADPGLRISLVHPDDRAKIEKHLHEIEHKQKGATEAEWRYARPDGTFCWVAHVCQPVYDDSGRFIGTRGSNRDITERKKKEEELLRLNRTLRAISNSNQAMMHAQDESQFLKEVCDIIIKDCGHKMAWVGIAQDDENKTVRPAASAGFEEGYLQTLNISWADTQQGRGPTGTAIRTGKMSMCRNMQTDPAFEPWRQEAIKRGYASSIVFPLILGDDTFGALTIYSREPDPFSRDEVTLLTELAGDLSYGIETIRARIERDHAEEAVRQSAGRFEILSETASKLLQSKEPQQIINTLCHKVMEHLDCHIFINYLIDEKIHRLRLNAFGGITDEIAKKIELLDFGQAICGRVAQEGKRIVAENIQESCDERADLVRSFGIKAYACHPIIAQNRVVGTLSFGTRSRTKYSDDDLALMKTVTDQVATALERILAQQALQNLNQELENRVTERTAQLTETVETLQEEVRLRTQAEKTVMAERQRFNDVLEIMPVYVILLTEDYHVPFANRFFEERFGASNGRKCYEYLFGRSEPCETCETFTVMKTGQPHHWEWTGPDKRNYDIFDFPFIDSDGSKLIMEVGIDVTEQKQAQEGLRSASLYSRGLLEAGLDPLVTISQDGKITDVNEATIKVTGINRDKLIGTDFSNYFTQPQKAREGYRQVFAKGFVTDYPLTVRHKDGKLTDVLYNATVYKDTGGNVIGIFASARDITERKTAEEKQRVINSLLELFARKTSRKEYIDSAVNVLRDWCGNEFVGIRIKDNNENIPYESCVGFDKEFLTLENTLNLKRDNCICMRTIMQKSFDPEHRFVTHAGSFFCNDSKAFLNSLTEQQRKEYRGNCIKWGFQSIAVIPIRYHQDVIGAIHITDFKKDMVPLSKVQFIEATIAPLIGEAIQRFTAEAELEKHRLHLEELVKQRTDDLTRSNKDLEQFAYVASHDLQEPLRMIAGYTQLLQQRYKDKLDENANQFIYYTVDGVVRMQSLINDLLSYSRLNTGSEDLKYVDCRDVLNEVLAALQMTIEESGADIKFGPMPTIRANKSQLLQLFQNLIGNAIKFRSDTPLLINITAKPQGKQWLFSVSDNGIGMEPQYLERIFVIFQRLHTQDKYTGTGIGLAICKKIVERHGGRIWAESMPGKGSTFYFII